MSLVVSLFFPFFHCFFNELKRNCRLKNGTGSVYVLATMTAFNCIVELSEQVFPDWLLILDGKSPRQLKILTFILTKQWKKINASKNGISNWARNRTQKKKKRPNESQRQNNLICRFLFWLLQNPFFVVDKKKSMRNIFLSEYIDKREIIEFVLGLRNWSHSIRLSTKGLKKKLNEISGENSTVG